MADERDWTREEVEATVATYLDMLELELAGRPHNKSEFRRTLMKLLRNRSETAVERKHMNISAVLVEMDHPYINGYKPLPNYQRALLPLVVAEQIDRRAGLAALAEVLGEVPVFDRILNRLMTPPEPLTETRRYRERPRLRLGIKTDYVEREAKNRALGRAGELFVLEFERARLVAARQERLAQQVEHVAATEGDGSGYDILSFDVSGRERLVEVKTTKGGQYTPFFVTRNEVEVSRDRSDEYQVYRVYSFGVDPRLYIKPGAVEHEFLLSPELFVARVG